MTQKEQRLEASSDLYFAKFLAAQAYAKALESLLDQAVDLDGDEICAICGDELGFCCGDEDED